MIVTQSSFFPPQKVLGVVIRKNDSKGFPDKKNVGSERHTFSFIIKDSPNDSINVSCWGSQDYIRVLSDSFSIGDRVLIENPLVVTKDIEKEERYSPWTPSLYRLMVSEFHSTVRSCTESEEDAKLPLLLHLPMKNPQDYYCLRDIVANGQALDGKVINILAGVRSIGEPKFFTTADRRTGQRCEVKLFDETTTSFPLVCWDNESIKFAQTWVPGETVLFIADVRINFDNFRNCMTATIISKTIVTINPDIKEANLIFNYMREFIESGGLDEFEDQMEEQVNLESIVDTYTVDQLKVRAQQDTGKSGPIYGVTYAFITALNLDSSVTKLIRTRCARCRFEINEKAGTCINETCIDSGNPVQAIMRFDLLVDLTDHTGTLQSCNLSGNSAEEMLNYTVDNFLNLTEDQKTSLKWQFLLERCKIFVKVTRFSLNAITVCLSFSTLNPSGKTPNTAVNGLGGIVTPRLSERHLKILVQNDVNLAQAQNM
uniref:Meiosis-specific with OB domain-containing protein n=1 Tax=Erpetoichthys calabaricus TaxID=27687 RepID=A0A8C4SET4_ERPCA